MSTVVSSSKSTVSPNTPRVACPLPTYPSGRIVIPLVSDVAKSPGRPAKATGTTMTVDGGEHGFPHERASAPRASNSVNLANDCVVQLKMHSHVYIFCT